MEEKDKENNKNENENVSKLKRIIINSVIIIVIFVIGFVMYAKYFGTKGINVREYRITDEDIPSTFSGSKVIYFSDTLLGSTVNIDDLKNVVSKINELKPDLVLFGGGLISEEYNLTDESKLLLIESLSEINASVGKYSVSGYEDGEIFTEIMNQSGFIILNNSFDYVYKEGEVPICLVGIDSYNLGKSNLESSFAYREGRTNCYSIVFTHEADIINKIMTLEVKPDVVFAGNSLGGEIDIPFYGPLKKFEGNTEYYLSQEEKEGMLIYVSNGIGTREYFMRFNNRPSISLFRLKAHTK